MPPPPAPGAGYQPYNPAAQQFASNVDVGDSLSWSFKKMQEHLVPFLTLSGVIVLVGVVGNIISWQLAENAGTTLEFNQDTGRIESSSGFFGGILGALLIAVIFGVVTWVLRIGLLRAALRTTQGQEPSLQDLTTGENTGKYIVTALVVGVLTWIGLFLCILPGLLAAFFLLFAATHALAKGANVGDSLNWSFNAVKANVVPVIVLVLLTLAVGLVGAFFRGIGGVIIVAVLTLFLEPFAALVNANIYRKMGNEPIAP